MTSQLFVTKSSYQREPYVLRLWRYGCFLILVAQFCKHSTKYLF